jgi:Mg-chelatase subunit ChlD
MNRVPHRAPVVTALAVLLGVASAAGCAPADSGDSVKVSVTHLQAQNDSGGAALIVEDSSGAEHDILGSNLTLEAEVQGTSGQWTTVGVRMRNQKPVMQTMLVADNSGSQDGNLDLMRVAAKQFAGRFLNQKDRKVGLVRVSTESKVLSPPTDDEEDFGAAVDAMFVSNGWTALYDGIRMANEELEANADLAVDRDGQWGCVDRPFSSVIVFTDGRDNNSSDMQMSEKYMGDGVDTRISDLYDLNVLGVETPVYTVGVGRAVDELSLSSLAEKTGGTYTAIDDYRGLEKELKKDADALSNALPFCFDLPYCDATRVRVHVTGDLDGLAIDHTVELEIPAGACSPGGSQVGSQSGSGSGASGNGGSGNNGNGNSGNGNSGNGNGNGGGNGTGNEGNGNGGGKPKK